MSELLTEKQEALLNFIEEYQMENGGSPTLREMREHFGVSSDNSILKHLKALEEKGKIEKDEKHRGIKMLSSIKEKLAQDNYKLPLLGAIPAGNPTASEEHVESWMAVGEDIIYKNKQSFLLRVKGDSMIDAGILQGDIVVALVDNENTVKRYMKDDDNQIYLKPENRNYENIYPQESLCVQGVVTGLIRHFKT
ncbi:MAG: transcriptional repressor LexA [Candidatus Altimarinota bacterium]